MRGMEYNLESFNWLPKTKSKKGFSRKILSIVSLVLTAILVFLACYLPLTYNWSQNTWSDLSINEIVYHLAMPMEGTGGGMIQVHIIKCLLPAIVITAAYVCVFVIIRKKINYSGYIKGIAAALSAVIIANTISSFWLGMDISKYMDNQSKYSSFIDDNYVNPNSVALTFPEQKRNLIYIFLESTENTFADKSVGGAFYQNVIPELTQLSLENENFSGGNTELNGGVPMTGATWTIGAMCAQTSGLPLSIQIDANDMSAQSNFYPGATTIGDILEEEGYNQTLLLGSDAVFGGRELYFTEHGNYAMRDYKYYTSNGTLPSDYYVWWGYEDKYLFENAKTELAELSASGEPFNLTMLTVDTHFEDGYICSECQNEYDDQYSNVYACASRQVNDFVEWLKTQPYYENTTIVIAGDHLTMDGDYCSNVDAEYERKVYTTIINGVSEVEEETYREYSTFDMFPTTLAALGVSIPGNKLALGTNLYSSEQTLLEIYGKKSFNDGLSSKSELIDNLTAGISVKMATLTPLEYNSDTKTIQVIASNIVVSEINEIGSMRLEFYNKNDTSTLHSYEGENRGDGTWIFTVNFADFAFQSGTYVAVAKAKDANAANSDEYSLGATTFELSDPTVDPNADAVLPEIGTTISDFDYASGTFKASYYGNNMADVVAVNFAVWKNEDQSDMRWYSGQYDENGCYSTSINAFDFSFDNDTFNIHTYITTTDGQVTYKDSDKLVVLS